MNLSIELKQAEQYTNSIIQRPSEIARARTVGLLYCNVSSVNSQASGGI
jgi:hypothetical protein